MLYSCLARLFPPSSFHLKSTSPLSVDDFRTVVLLPELAVRLIMQDLGQDRASAINTLLASIKYGNTRFPLDLEDERVCNLMIWKAYRNIRVEGESGCDPQAINQKGVKRRRVLRSMLPAILDTVEGDTDGHPNDGAERKRQKGSSD